MLKLKKVQILGFKSFCDRTEVQLAGEGIVAIVGPNGCGKSNISDAITWVLGEQSAKSLRGIKMEDVIFAGTRDRKPTGMAEVSLTLVDPEVYDGQTLADGEPEIVIADEHPAEAALNAAGDWDETALRAQIAQETEEAVTEAQPGQTYEARIPRKRKPVLPENATPDQLEAYEASLAEYEAQQAADAEAQANAANAEPGAEGEAEASVPAPNANVVLKIRRRKFGRTPVRAGEITVTRRLFRSGDSEYLLNGKICRLSDIKDIFMGTGLGGESYAIIGQERIGQLLSSKPLDRRSIIEEAAGITRFKTKKRLAELRLESAKQNLARVNDIFEEVTRQMGSLKRQAAKAERYREVQTELRSKLRTTLASRLSQMDTDRQATEAEIARLAGLIEEQASGLDGMDAEHTSGVSRGYELDQAIREGNARANSSAVELERIAARTTSNNDRIEDLAERAVTGSEEMEQAKAQSATLAAEREQHKAFLETANSEANAAREAAREQSEEAQAATREVLAAEANTEQQRRNAMSAMQRAAQANNEIAQAEAALQGLDRENDRLEGEREQASQELEQLGQQRGQAKMVFEDVTERLKRLENEINEVRQQLQSKREEETQSRRRSNELRAEVATLTGRRTSIEALINEHSYSTDTVRNIFRANQKNPGDHTPIGTLADFLEVDGKYEQVVDEFLRDELNYVVVKSWQAAQAGMSLLQTEVEGRATFLVHPQDAHSSFPLEQGMDSATAASNGVIALKDCIRVQDGFGKSLEVILPKLREGFIAPDVETARTMALAYPQSFFLAPNGETFNSVTVTGGRPRSQGPLALKRELAEVQAKLEAVEAELARNETATLTLTRDIAELSAMLENKQAERRDAERESANQGAALRQMESEAQRIQSRLQQYELAQGRNKDQRQQREAFIARKREEAERFAAEQTALELQVQELTERIANMRADREALQAAASAANAMLAGIEERRRNANANFEQTSRLFNTQQQRIQQLESQLASAHAEKARREEENTALAAQHTELTEIRAQAVAETETLSAEASSLRARIAELDTKLRSLRSETEGLREQRSTLTAKQAKLTSDLEHLEATCLNDLAVEANVLREDDSIERIEGDALSAEEEAARTLKGKLEAMGPVNMMALEEFAETSQRHEFLETQRKDLFESIENTQASIKEIDEISRVKFDEAFAIINENFSTTFTKLFGGGQAFMKLTDPEANGKNGDLSGIDIIASPPGKKLQNVLLLSGGEKALTALSLLVGIFQFQPAPFCILDEVDAPLDETNVGRFARLVAEMSNTTQFIVITHSKRTMEQADVMYGVTMQEPGVSKIVSVSLGGRSQGKESRSAQAAA
ncbi:MAG: chromosome segregation protein SMC [Acidobacteriaceae bacterium]|nr:chromosome segregation protein SMC [Acidobacteriaceae bacterium]